MTDNQLLISCSVILLLLICISFRISRLFFTVNITLFILYSSWFYYGLYFMRGEGIALAWWFYLLLITLFHLFAVAAYLAINWIKGEKPKA